MVITDHLDPDELAELEGRDADDYTDEKDLQLPSALHAARINELFNDDGTVRKLIRARKSAFVHNLIHLDGKKFDFTGRRYLEPIYDRSDQRILLKTARQVEKCLVASSQCTLSDGSEKPIDQMTVGDTVIAIDAAGHQAVDTVVASEDNGPRRCVRLRTRLGSTLEVTLNHPLRRFDGWVEAGRLVPGDRVAALRTVGTFGTARLSWAALLGLLVGDGHYYRHKAGGSSFGFTQKGDEVNAWADRLLELAGDRPSRTWIDERSGTKRYAFSLKGPLAVWFRDRGIANTCAREKHLPAEVFGWDKETTRDLLRGLWATDGHCKNVSSSKVDLVYCTTSPVLARQVRLLLRKFGVVTVQRENKLSNGGRLAYNIRVITRRAVACFHRELGPIPGKPFTLSTCRANSNLDTLPKEIHEFILQARKDRGTYWQRNGFQSAGLRVNRSYCPTYEKVAAMNVELESGALAAILESDVIWDEIVTIEDLGMQPTWGIQTETETFVADFILNHNTTFLANNLVAISAVKPFNKCLYVSPSHTQTRQFSSEKLKPAIEKSPLIMKYLQDSGVSNQVFEKGFTNGAFIFLRSAFRSADRARGISARVLALDEFQDMLISEIPVIRECTSHFPDAIEIMAGTPKSLDNPIEIYWQSSTQNEWLVPCGCGHWNMLDETTIGPTQWYESGRLPPGPVCSKCVRPLDVTKGQWMSLSGGKAIAGYRIPQLMVPWIISTMSQWSRLLWKRDHYPFGQFANEVLGLSYDAASKPISRAALMGICGDYALWDPNNLTPYLADARSRVLIGGVDWGEGNDGSEKSPSGKIRNASYTVLTLGYYETQRKFRTVLVKKYVGREVDPEHVVNDICRISAGLGVRVLGVDYGHGWGLNNVLVRKLGPKRVMQFQYLHKLKNRIKWDALGTRYHLHRNLFMSELFYDMKNGHVGFPKWAEFEPYAKDILSIYTEYNEFRREIKFDHRPSDPDDFFHSLLFCKLAADIFHGKSRRYTQIEGGPMY
jgi:hypothetical protein